MVPSFLCDLFQLGRRPEASRPRTATAVALTAGTMPVTPPESASDSENPAARLQVCWVTLGQQPRTGKPRPSPGKRLSRSVTVFAPHPEARARVSSESTRITFRVTQATTRGGDSRPAAVAEILYTWPGDQPEAKSYVLPVVCTSVLVHTDTCQYRNRIGARERSPRLAGPLRARGGGDSEGRGEARWGRARGGEGKGRARSRRATAGRWGGARGGAR